MSDLAQDIQTKQKPSNWRFNVNKTFVALTFALALTACSPVDPSEEKVLYCTIGDTPTFISPPATFLNIDDSLIKLYKKGDVVGIHKLRPGESCVTYDKNHEIVREQPPNG